MKVYETLLLPLAAVLLVGVSGRVVLVDPVCKDCPSKNCTYDEKLRCSCVGLNRTIEIVNPGDREYTNVSLGFAI
uniref:Secreted protein n=1 Tax=Macrostomum lignano TaxID=282301 RepID=A0A1I8I1T2_9PLAT